ncbi:MAG: rhodanese-like domain-containing protein [Burkholderiaceae bacterium]
MRFCHPARAALQALMLMLALLAAAPAAAQSADGRLIVDTAWVERALQRGAVLWDARSPREYAEGHIAGAVNFGAAGDLFRDPNREDPPSAAVAAQLFGQAGIDILRQEVVVYAQRGDPMAYFAARMTEYYGGRHAKVYHGGLDDWRAAGKAVTPEPTKRPPVQLALRDERVGTLWTHEVVDRVRAGGAQILDTRTPREFSGDDIRAIRGGHVSGAVNVPYEANWVDPQAAVKLAARQVATRDGMTLKPEAELKALYAGLDPKKETVVYCQSGVRASETAAVLRDLGFANVKVYEPSWLGYAGVLSAPADNEVFVNVGALNGQISALQGRLRALEDELAKQRTQPAPQR